ncbi:MAG: hypothetical protein AAGK78_05755 [Planctomycetota bacterium]
MPIAQPHRVDEEGEQEASRLQRLDRIEPYEPPPAAMDAQPRQSRRFALRVYELNLPAGQVSTNQQLWRRIDEQAIGVAEYDLLWTNGLRAGVAPNDELPGIAETLARQQAPLTNIIGGSEDRQVQQMVLGNPVGEQTIFWFDQAKQPVGETFEDAQMMLNLAFEAAPGQRGAVRIAVRPIVQGTKDETRVFKSGDEYVVRQGRAVTPLDVEVLADVPLGSFLIVSPSPESKWSSSVGGVFFASDVSGEPLERVLLVVPQRLEVQGADA